MGRHRFLHMKFTPALLIILCIVFPSFPGHVTIVTVITLAIFCTKFFKGNKLLSTLFVFLTLLPITLLFEPNVIPPDLNQVEERLDLAISSLGRPDFLDRHADLFNDWENHESEIYTILDNASSKSQVAYTLVDLNFNPRIWSGHVFSDDYSGLSQEQLFWIFRDNRAILAKIIPYPNQESRSFNLISELLVVSGNILDRPQAWYQKQHEGTPYQPIQWMTREFPVSRFFQPVFTLQKQSTPEPDPGIMDALPVNVQWVPFHDAFSPRELVALIWVATFCLLIFFYFHDESHWNKSNNHWRLALSGGCLLILSLPLSIELDYLQVFSNSFFSAWNVGNLLASPYHLITFFLFLYLFIKNAINDPRLNHITSRSLFRFLPKSTLTLTLLSLAFFPNWMQRNTQVSLCHPKEAFLGTGSFLVFFASLLILNLFIHLLLQSRKPSPVLMILVQFACFYWAPLPISLSLLSLWFILELNRIPGYKTKLNAPWFHRALTALLVSSMFYFQLVSFGNRELHQFIQKDWLQEATLVDQENHNRVMRVLDAFKTYQHQFSSFDNSYLASWLAKRSGLSEEAVEYSLLITTSEGDTISRAENKISLDSIAYEFAPSNRIEYLPEPLGSSRILLFRRPFEHHGESGELVIAITDRFQNLTSTKRTSSLFQNEGLEVPFKHGSVALKVYDKSGNPLNDLENPSQIPKEAFNKLQTKPFFSIQHKNTTQYFFNDNQRLFMIRIGSVTPIFLLARFLLIFVFCWGILTLLHRSEKLKKRTLFQLYARSFRFRLATLFFSVSLFPILMLLALFFGNFKNNQLQHELKQLIQQAFRIQSTFDPSSMMQFKETGDISLFEFGSLVETTYPELFSSGMLSSRMPFQTWKKLLNKDVSYCLEKVKTELPFSLNAVYLTHANQTVLGITHYADSVQFREELEDKLEVVFSLTFLILIGTSFFALNFSRVFMRPIASITRSATKMQRSVKQKPIPTFQKQNDLNRMIHAFNSMQEKITWNEKERQSQIDLLTLTLETMKTGLIGLNPQREIILCNKAFFAFFPSLKDPESGESIHPTLSPFKPRSELNLEKIYRVIPDLKNLFDSQKSISLSIRKNNQPQESIILCRLDIRHIEESKQGLKYIFLFEDITPQIETSRLKAWSEMARRIAHEIKNPLTPIQLEIDHINALYQDNHPNFKEALQEASIEIRTQLHKTATEFGDYARPVALDMKLQYLLPIVKECVSSYERTQDRIKINLKIQDNPLINVDMALTKKAISNLLINSYEAMHEGSILLQMKTENRNLILTLEDNGPGIDLDEKGKIFEAYFSTKTRGTGLGLAIAKKSFEAQGAGLTLDKNFDDGTRFFISFPVHET